jgi:hypothetical protein
VDETNPYTRPTAPAVKPLGSLAQAARGSELTQAQRILVAIGALTLAVNGFFLFNLQNEIQQAIQQNQIDPSEVEQVRQAATISGYLIYGLPALLGLVFIVFGLIIKRFPVPITVTSLILYLLAAGAFAFLDPKTLFQGLVLKVIVIFALIRAIKAALAFRSPTTEADGNEGLVG